MAKSQGKNYKLGVESATPGTYNKIKGQGDLKRTDGLNYYDLSDKDSGDVIPQQPGRRTIAFSLDMKIDLPDANGYTRVETLAANKTPFNIQLDNGATTPVVVYQGSVYCVITDRSYPSDGMVTCTMSFTAAAAPTIDTMA